MFLHLTTGTLSYLTSLKDQHNMLKLNANSDNAVVYYESSDAKSLFNEQSAYEVKYTQGSLHENHPTSFHFVPVPDAEGSIRIHFNEFKEKLENVNGVQSYRIGLDANGTYVVLIQWAEHSTYTDFKSTTTYTNYLSTEVLKKYRDSSALFTNAITSHLYLPISDVEVNENEEL